MLTISHKIEAQISSLKTTKITFISKALILKKLIMT